MKTLLIALLALATGARAQADWNTDWDAARAQARAQHRPILLLQLFGRLDEPWC